MYISPNNEMGVEVSLWLGKPPRCLTSRRGQLSLPTYAGWEMSTSESAVMLCSWQVKAGWLIPHVLSMWVITVITLIPCKRAVP